MLPASTAAVSAPQTRRCSAEVKGPVGTRKPVFQPRLMRPEAKNPSVTEEQVKLGNHFGVETRLSKGNTVSCNSCHNPGNCRQNNMPTSAGPISHLAPVTPLISRNARLVGGTNSGTAVPPMEEQAGGPLLPTG